MDDAQPGNFFGKAFFVMILWIGLASLGYYFLSGNGDNENEVGEKNQEGEIGDSNETRTNSTAANGPRLKIGIAYGTEKRRWLKESLERFNNTAAGKRIEVDLIPMGSLEGAHAILDGDERIHVWSPASSMYRGVFEDEWENQELAGDPIARDEVLALTPMVFVAWKNRYDEYVKKYESLSFLTIADAMYVEGGWGGIAEKPEWGLFKFGHTHPNQSNSGLMTLVLLQYDYFDKTSGLSRQDTVNPEFQKFLANIERGVTGLSNSTGNMMRDMIRKGPSAYDVVMVYESVAIDYLDNAAGRWGELAIAYPRKNLWNDNPYYILNTKWSRPEHRQAAEEFLDFLMSEEIQQLALDHGFRPGNVNVDILNNPESPFEKYGHYGLKIEFPGTSEPPPAAVIRELQTYWQRAVGR